MTQQDRPATATPATAQDRARLPFAGLRVLDVSQGISGPYCAHILWQQGADVVKVEPPAGDWARGMGILREGTSSLAIAFNGGKQAICVDATQPQGREVLQRLAAERLARHGIVDQPDALGLFRVQHVTGEQVFLCLGESDELWPDHRAAITGDVGINVPFHRLDAVERHAAIGN